MHAPFLVDVSKHEEVFIRILMRSSAHGRTHIVVGATNDIRTSYVDITKIDLTNMCVETDSYNG